MANSTITTNVLQATIVEQRIVWDTSSRELKVYRQRFEKEMVDAGEAFDTDETGIEIMKVSTIPVKP